MPGDWWDLRVVSYVSVLSFSEEEKAASCLSCKYSYYLFNF